MNKVTCSVNNCETPSDCSHSNACLYAFLVGKTEPIMEHRLTTKAVTVNYNGYVITIPPCTMAVLVQAPVNLSAWAVKSPRFIFERTGEINYPKERYCWLPDEAFQ